MFKRYWWVIVLILALVAGGVVAWCANGTTEDPSAVQVDTSIDAVAETVGQLAQTVEAIARHGQKEVTVIRETVKREVGALPPDDVCAALNDELSRFRLDSRSSGVDCSD